MEIGESEEEIHDREKIAKQIAKTSEAIRRKYRALKTGRMEEDIALEKHFRPVVEPLKKLVENTADSFVRMKDEPTNFTRAESYTHPTRRDGDDDDSEIPRKRKRSSLDKKHPTRRDGDDDDDSEIPRKRKCSSTDYDLIMDKAYGVYLGNEGMMLGCKRFETDRNDNILIDGMQYTGTPGLYELIFMKEPDKTTYTETDMQTYKEILLATNVHKVNYKAENRVRGSKGRKYKDPDVYLVEKVLRKRGDEVYVK
ncbi:hypothetical protein X777_11283 [Ooceraea biroi]|uniref:DUF8207 domain-containing protein n=1 Tax=Ooceraea biroi TaxID=2015173 RepID=A0A026W2J2_OOCBI|nr:hypothetical protein X777_11283 [Ooceraea biroi]